MSLRNMTPLAHAVMDAGQSGSIMVLSQNSGWILTGHADGSSGAGTQDYTELLAGKECNGNTSKQNTTGTLFFPEIDSFHSIMNISRDTGGALVDVFIQAKCDVHDHLARNPINYDPGTASPSNYALLTNGDTIFGRFVRIALSKPHLATADRYRIIITKGVDNGS